MSIPGRPNPAQQHTRGIGWIKRQEQKRLKREDALRRQQQKQQRTISSPPVEWGQSERITSGFLGAILLLPIKILLLPFKILKLLVIGIFTLFLQVLKYVAIVIAGFLVLAFIGTYFDIEIIKASLNLFVHAAMLLYNEILSLIIH